MAVLFDEFLLKDVVLRNRIAVLPMCQYSSDNGFPNDWHFVHLGSRAVGGAGLVVVEATAVSPEGRISPADSGIWLDDHVQPLARISHFLKQYGAVPGIQLAHAGRKASANKPWEGDNHIETGHGGWDTIAPSPVAFGPNLPKVPREMSVQDIARIPVAGRIRRETGVPTAVGWMITDPHQANEAVRDQHTDLVLLARELLRDPYWPYHAAVKLGSEKAETILPIQYARAVKR